jgi:hypothetical protein
MKKLKLNKQTVIKLSDAQASNITGGGIDRSNRRTGDCRYSRNHDTTTTDTCAVTGIGYCNALVDTKRASQD